MEQKFKKFITLNHLFEEFKNFNKKILSKKYFKKDKGEILEEKVSKIIGNDENISIRDMIEKLKKISRTFILDGKELPDANGKEADINCLYLYRDKDAIDEKSVYYIYTLKEDETGTRKWACISAPSYVYETEQINFQTAFDRAEKKFTRKTSFVSYQNLIDFLKKKNQIYRYKGRDSFYYDLLTNDFKDCCCVYTEATKMLYYFETIKNNIQLEVEADKQFNVNVDRLEATNLANIVQNPDGEPVNASNN